MKRRTLLLLTAAWLGLAVLSVFIGRTLGTPGEDAAEDRPGFRGPRRIAFPAAELKGSYALVSRPEWRPAALTTDETGHLIRTALTPQGIGRLAEAQAALLSLSAGEAEEFLTAVLLPRSPRSPELISAALAAIARTDAPRAMGLAEKHLSETGRFQAIERIMGVWAATDPQAALTWHRAAHASAPQTLRHRYELAFNSLIHSWALRDPQAAFAACLSEPEHGTFDAWAGFSGLAAAPEQRDTILALLAGIADEKVRNRALPSALRAWAADDPSGAAAWIDAQTFPADPLIDSVADAWGRTDIEAAADWRVARSNPDTRDEAISRAVSGWAHRDPQSAARWLERIGPTQPAISQIAVGYAEADPVQAITWTMRLQDETARRQILGSVLWHARRQNAQINLTQFSGLSGLSVDEMNTLIGEAEEQRKQQRNVF